MYETSIALGLIDTAAAVVPPGGRITGVRVRLGALSGICDDALEFAFRTVSVGTVADGAKLSVELVPVRLWCPSCSAVVVSMRRVMRCVRCRTPGEVMVNGREFEVVSVDVDERVIPVRQGSALMSPGT